MKIVVTKSVTMFVEKFVSYMKHEGHYSLPALIRNKKNMLQHLRGFINKVVVANDNKTPKRYYCSWRDGQTPMTWIFYFVVLPQQDMTVIYGLTPKRSVEMPDRQIKEDKDVKKILSLMDRMGMQTQNTSEQYLSHLLEEEYEPTAYNKTIELSNDVKVKSLVTLTDGAGGRYEIYEDDGCYVCCDMNLELSKNYNNYKPMYIFPELHKALKKLPNLQL